MRLILVILLLFSETVLSKYYEKRRFDRSIYDDSKRPNTNKLLPNKQWTLTDHETHFKAYKDTEENNCYIERLENNVITEESSENKIQQQKGGTKIPCAANNVLTKLMAWQIAGGRIVDFCKGRKIILLRNTIPIPDQTRDPFFNILPIDENDIVTKRVAGVILTPLINRTKRKIVLEERQKRLRRQAHQSSGRFRGQTQSQYLSNGNSDQKEGKAEAEATQQSSRAVVSGSNGMGQAQSMSLGDIGCEDCPKYVSEGTSDKYVQLQPIKQPGGVISPNIISSGGGATYQDRVPDGRPRDHTTISGTAYPGGVPGTTTGDRTVYPEGVPGTTTGDRTAYPGGVPGTIAGGRTVYPGGVPGTIAGDRTVYPGGVPGTIAGGRTVYPGGVPGTIAGDRTVYPGGVPGTTTGDRAVYPGGVPGTIAGDRTVYPGGVPGTTTGDRTVYPGGVPGTIAGDRTVYPGGVPGTIAGDRTVYPGGVPGTITGDRAVYPGGVPGTIAGDRTVYPGEVPGTATDNRAVYPGGVPGTIAGGRTVYPGGVPGTIAGGRTVYPGGVSGTIARDRTVYPGGVPGTTTGDRAVYPGGVSGTIAGDRTVYPGGVPGTATDNRAVYPGGVPGTATDNRAVYPGGVPGTATDNRAVYPGGVPGTIAGDRTVYPGGVPGTIAGDRTVYPEAMPGTIAGDRAVYPGGAPVITTDVGVTYPGSVPGTTTGDRAMHPRVIPGTTIDGGYPGGISGATSSGSTVYTSGTRDTTTGGGTVYPGGRPGTITDGGTVYPGHGSGTTTGGGITYPEGISRAVSSGGYPGGVPDTTTGGKVIYPGVISGTTTGSGAVYPGSIPGITVGGEIVYPGGVSGATTGGGHVYPDRITTQGDKFGTYPDGVVPSTTYGQVVTESRGTVDSKIYPGGQIPTAQYFNERRYPDTGSNAKENVYHNIGAPGTLPAGTTGGTSGQSRENVYYPEKMVPGGTTIPSTMPGTSVVFPSRTAYPGATIPGTTGHFIPGAGRYADNHGITPSSYPVQTQYPGTATWQDRGISTAGVGGDSVSRSVSGQVIEQYPGQRQDTKQQYPGFQYLPDSRPIGNTGKTSQYYHQPTSFLTTEDDNSNSQASSSVKETDAGTQASASAQGKFGQGTAQSQVTGTYSGSGSFSAQAGSTDVNKSAQTEINGGKEGAVSNAQGVGGYGKSQAQVQLNSESGATKTGAQSSGKNHGTNSQVQASSKGGMADAQANGEGSTSSQAQIGFQPYLETDEKIEKYSSRPFHGGGTASAQSGAYTGQSQSQLEGSFQYGITYTGAAQAGAGSGAATSRKPFNFSFADTEPFKPFKLSDVPQILPNNNSKVTNTSSDRVEEYNQDKLQQGLQTSSTSRRRVIAKPIDESSQNIADKSDQSVERQQTDDTPYYYDEEYDGEDYGVTAIESSMNSKPSKVYATEQDDSIRQLQSIQVANENQFNVHVKQDTNAAQVGDMLQPGQSVSGYTIPHGFRGRVTSIAGEETVANGDGKSQSQTVSLAPKAPSKAHENKSPISEIRSLKTNRERFMESHTLSKEKQKHNFPHTPKAYLQPPSNASSNPSYYTVTNSVAGKMDDKNSSRKYEHRYYTKSSTCGYFTFSCNIVYGSNGRTKICKPKLPTHPDGTPMRC